MPLKLNCFSSAGGEQNAQRPMSVAMSEFSGFLQKPLGLALLDSQRHQLSAHLPSLTGYNCLQLSVQQGLHLYDTNAFGHYIKMGYAAHSDKLGNSHLVADFHALPIASDCIDIALLHHVLDFSDQPHQLLREADRTLTAGGHMLMLGFNPISIWPLYKLYTRWFKGQPISCSAIRSGRLTDWLSLLNYDVLHRQAYFYHLPFISPRWFKCGNFIDRAATRMQLPFGIYYLIVARKRTSAMTAIKDDWRIRFKASNPTVLQSKNAHSYKLQDKKTSR